MQGEKKQFARMYRVPKEGDTIENLIQAMLDATPVPDTIYPEEITGTLGRILDEVDLPADLQTEVEGLYKRAVKEVQ